MKKFANALFGSPYFLRELLFAGKYAALLQFLAAIVFCGLARFGGPLGSLESAEILREAALVTLTVTAAIEMMAGFLRRMKAND